MISRSSRADENKTQEALPAGGRYFTLGYTPRAYQPPLAQAYKQPDEHVSV
jgi:hypothetical protein